MIPYITPLFNKIVFFIGSIEWKTKRYVSQKDLDIIKGILKDDYCIMVTRRSNHLSTYFIGLIEVFLRFKIGYWSHSLMNLEDNVTEDKDFRILQATGVGTAYAEFDKVFDVQGVALLKPKSMTLDEWTTVLDTAKAQLGKPYDTLFNIADDSKLSCIELTRKILMASPNYAEDFKHFEEMIKKYKNVSPQMLYDCKDFDVVFEVRV